MSGVKVTFLSIREILEKLEKKSLALRKERPVILEVRLFGSLARGDAVPGSDADLLIIMEKDNRRFLDRLEDFLIFFSDLGISIDVFPYTADEFENLKNQPFWITALKESILLS